MRSSYRLLLSYGRSLRTLAIAGISCYILSVVLRVVDAQENPDFHVGKELAALVDSNWFVQREAGTPRFPPPWNFEAGLKKLSYQSIRLLKKIHFVRLRLEGRTKCLLLPEDVIERGPQRGGSVARIRKNFSGFISTLKLIALCEYRIDSLLLHPPNLRGRELAELAALAGTNVETLKAFCLEWYSQLREKVYGKGGYV